MKLEEAKKVLAPITGRRLCEFLSNKDMKDIIKNNGKSGQLLEIILGLKNSNTTLDFEDGELKTNKCDKYGNPKETMFITQILSIIDELLEQKNFYETHLYKKISNLLYVPINKDGQPAEWFFLPYVHVNLNENKFSELRNQLESDYYNICSQLKYLIENSADGFIHTSNGKYIQIRSKDSKPYHPIYSNLYKRNISNKSHAFYFEKKFMKYIKNF